MVERYAARFDAGEVGRVGTANRTELSAVYGSELGEAIAEAAFRLPLRNQYDHGGNPAACENCRD